NLLRPAGLARLGAPVMLSGTGMAVRTDQLHRMRDVGDELAEDLVLSRRLLADGVRVGFVPEARVTSDAPPDRAGLTAQRERWEGGTLRAMAGVPAIAARCAARGDAPALVTLTDASAPPMALGVAAWGGLTGVAGVARVLTGRRGLLTPMALAGGMLAGYLAVGTTAARGPRGLLELARMVPGFIGWKLGVYRRMTSGEASAEWRRTPRTATEELP
ncbi:MAG: glycosyltransferase family 2 protein, partial [Thermoleophilia bacterium]